MSYAIFFDLDGTALTTDKRLSEANYRALEKAAEAGVWVIPATGRLYDGMPEEIRSLPFVKYAVTVNGAQVWDVDAARSLKSEEIPTKRAIEIFDILHAFDGVYDCYAGGWGYMERDMYDRAEDYVIDPAFLRMVKTLRKPVDDIRAYVSEHFATIQKVQMFFHSPEEHRRATEHLRAVLTDCCVSSSVKQNIEINIKAANKGEGMRFICEYLGVPIENTLAFGDGSNDLTMLRAAGVGVAMKNAAPEVIAAADRVTDTNDSDGVAKGVEKWLREAVHVHD